MTGSVRFRAVLAFAVLGASISAAASKCGSLSITSVLPAPYLSRGSLLVPRFPCPSLRCGRKLARQGLVWIFLRHRRLVWVSLRPLSSASVSRTCVHLTQFPRSTLCVVGLCALISAPGAHSASQGYCGLVLAPCACLLCCGVYVHLLHLTLSRRLFAFLSAVLEGLCALPKFACLPSMTPQARNLRRLCLSARSHSATWASPLCCKGCVHWLGLYAHHSRFCEPAMFGATVHEL